MTLFAIALAVTAAVLFGLAAVDQHRAVRHAAVESTTGRGGWRVVTRRGWLRGAARAGVAGGLHSAALALAPIMAVQPIGVLAVPVAVVVGSLRRGERPRRRQLLGSVLAVLGVAGLTLMALRPTVVATAYQPPLLAQALVVVPVVIAAVLVERRGRWWPTRLRCAALAISAATLFGLTSVLVRTAAQLATTVVGGAGPLATGSLVAALAGIAICAPVGLWAIQTAYAAGSPQVVLCCLTLVDPLVAILGSAVLLHETPTLSIGTALGALGCIAAAATAVVLLSTDHPQAALPPGDRHPGRAADHPDDDTTKQKVGALS